jgi:hypothetical protein
VTRVNTTVIHNVYERRVVERSVSRVSYNGGRGGINVRPSAREETAMRERRFGATSVQAHQESLARSDRRQWASENHGRPGVTASQRAGEFGSRSAEARNTRTATETRNHAAETSRSAEQRNRATETHADRAARAPETSHHATNNAPRESARTTHPNTAPRTNTATHNEHHNVSAPSSNHAQTPHTAVRTEPSRTHTNTNAGRQPNHSEVRSPSTSTHNAAPRQNVRQEHSAPTHAPAQHQAPQSHASGGGGERSGKGGHGNTPRGEK